MRYLIAGSSGFLGTRLRERLEAEGHQVTSLVRRPPRRNADEIQWDPYAAPLGAEVVDNHEVVVNLAGSPTAGNPHSKKWASNLRQSRVTTTRVLADAIARGERRPVFVAGNAVGFYGDHGDAPVTEDTTPSQETFMSSVCRDWQRATDPAAKAGARVVVLRTSPVMDRRSQPLGAMRLLFKAGLGGAIGDGSQRMPMITARDWTDAVVQCVEHDLEGPVNLSCAQTPTNAEFTRTLAELVHRPAFVRMPAFVVEPAAGRLAKELLGSVDVVPQRLLDSGFRFSDPDVRSVLAEGMDPTR